MSEWMLLPDGVSKKIIHGGKGDIPQFIDNGKAHFYFQASYIKDNGEKQLLDDSRTEKKPFELLLGKKFKLEVWESLIKTMRIDEVAEFTCEMKLVGSYAVVSKSLRDMAKKQHSHHDNHKHDHTHQCGFAALSQGLGYPDLDEYVKNPKPIVFLIELLEVVLPGTYEKELWSISLDEKLKLIPQWKEEGNKFYKQGDLDGACKKYSDALGSLEQLTTREKPGTEEWLELEKMKIPLLLNYAQCMLGKKEYYQAIEHLTTVLEKDKENVKALYRRAKAYHLIYSFNESIKDYKLVQLLDKSLISTVDKELKCIQIDQKKKDEQDRQKYKNAFS